jgi:hypothetical protein
VLFMITPFVLAHMHSETTFQVRSYVSCLHFAARQSLITPSLCSILLQSLLHNFPIFYFFLPTIVSDFLSYSLCRLDDWSWGNKEGMLTSAQIKVREGP